MQLLGLREEVLIDWLKEQGQPRFRAGQILSWVWKKGASSFAEMTDLPKEMREQLTVTSALTEVKRVDSSDGETTKFLWKLEDGNFIESVLIRAPGRHTVCVSSQVGCPARCAFCASGKEGLMRNLTPAEIVEQVVRIHRVQPITNVVFMGMGEPLENYGNVVESIRLLIDPRYFGLSKRRITVSTVGVVEGIDRLLEEDLGVNLVLSLHAPTQDLRKKIIPYARRYPLEDVMAAMDRWQARTGRDVTFEYTLLDGLNDKPEHADLLVQLLGRRQCTVNLIPYNPVAGLRLKRPSGPRILEFRDILEQGGLVTTCRYTKGDDIAAACGQLAMQPKA